MIMVLVIYQNIYIFNEIHIRYFLNVCSLMSMVMNGCLMTVALAHIVYCAIYK